MSDIVERLRGWREVPGLSCPPFLGEAADEIERLRAALEAVVLRYETEGGADWMVEVARRALEPSPPARGQAPPVLRGDGG